MTTPTAATTTTTTTAPLHWGWRDRGQAILGLSRLLDGYEAVRWDHDERAEHQHTQQAVQADEACWVAGWLWQGLVEAQTQADLNDVAASCEEQARDRQDGGHGWAADVWEDVARYIRSLVR